MHPRITPLAAAALAALLAGPAPAAEDNTQALVDDMNRLLDQAENDRSASPWFIQEARDVLRRYHWPWRDTLLDETFSDGDYTRGPTWVVDSGDFWVARSVGLRSRVTARSAPPTGEQGGSRDAASQIVGILMQEVLKDGGRQQAEPAAEPGRGEIHTELDITNAFLVEVDVAALGASGESRFSFGPYQGPYRDTGYQLVYLGGSRPAIELRRFSPRRSAIVDVREDVPALDDGGTHTLTWQRRDNGEMTVLLDGSELFTAVDRGLRDPFTGFTLVNEGGDFAFSRVRIDGAGS
jgi:hypothetical protein